MPTSLLIDRNLEGDSGLARVREGVQLGRLRRIVVSLSDRVGTLMRERLVPLLRYVRDVLPAYERAARLHKG